VSEFEDRLRIVPGFRPDEYEAIRKVMFGRLDRRLSRFEPEQVELELSVKERDTSSQRVALEAWISGLPKLVATSTQRDLDRALVEVRDDLWRQLDRHVTRKQAARKR
jgi:ribosome-associated translation inhibitor RaiA